MKVGKYLINKLTSLRIGSMRVKMSLNIHLISTIKKSLLLFKKILIYLFQVIKHFRKFLNFFFIIDRVKKFRNFMKKIISMLEDLKVGFLQKFIPFTKEF
jgi:hypothetical protein